MEQQLTPEQAYERVDLINDALTNCDVPSSMESSAALLLVAAQSWIVAGRNEEWYRRIVKTAAATMHHLCELDAPPLRQLPVDRYDAIIEQLTNFAAQRRDVRVKILLALLSAKISLEWPTPLCLLVAGLLLQARSGMPGEIVEGTAHRLYELAGVELELLGELS